MKDKKQQRGSEETVGNFLQGCFFSPTDHFCANGFSRIPEVKVRLCIISSHIWMKNRLLKWKFNYTNIERLRHIPHQKRWTDYIQQGNINLGRSSLNSLVWMGSKKRVDGLATASCCY